jgi:hypothetical protein
MRKDRKDRKDRRTAPLRKIVSYEDVDVSLTPGSRMVLQHEKLECGHTQLPLHDIFGETNADRRRCVKCLKEGQKV